MTDFRDVWYEGVGGLRLYARDYAHPSPRATLLCMHGLTRNSADFEDLCAALHADYRLIAVDQRGRGRSAYDANPDNYQPLVYVQDMVCLLRHLGLAQVVALGTSMGGLMTMIMAATMPGVLKAAIINDIGPVLEESGLDRIKSYVGKTRPAGTWNDAAEQVALVNGDAFPDYGHADWLAFAHRTYRESADGNIELAYDPAIATGLTQEQANAVPPDLWPMWEAFKSLPTLVIRGAISDILSSATVAEMQHRKPDLVSIEVPNRGHAPMLTEPAALAAIRDFLDSLCS